MFCIAVPLTTWESNSLFLFFIDLSNMYNSNKLMGVTKHQVKKKMMQLKVFTILVNAKSSVVSSINEKVCKVT